MSGANKIVEYVFFFGLLGAVAYLVWEIIAPFTGALALAAIIVTICYPLYELILRRITRGNKTIASFLSVLVVLIVVIIPLVLLGSVILREAHSIYSLVSSDSQVQLETSLQAFEDMVQRVIPGFLLKSPATSSNFQTSLPQTLAQSLQVQHQPSFYSS